MCVGSIPLAHGHLVVLLDMVLAGAAWVLCAGVERRERAAKRHSSRGDRCAPNRGGTMPTVTKTSGFFSARGKHSLHKLRDTSGGGQTIEESQVPTAQTRHQDARQPGRDRVIATSRVGCARSKMGVSTARLERGSYGDHHHHHHRNHHHRHCLRHGGGDNPANRQTSRIVRGRTRPRGGFVSAGSCATGTRHLYFISARAEAEQRRLYVSPIRHQPG